MPPLPFYSSKPCPCNSKQSYAQCCGPRLSGEQPAQTPEALMRSRYTAYVLQDAAYLLATWHPTTRPAELEVGPQPQWLGLNVRRELRERSTFVQESGKWFYLDGVED